MNIFEKINSVITLDILKSRIETETSHKFNLSGHLNPCPFCGHQDCFYIHEPNGVALYACQSCGTKGDIINFYAAIKKSTLASTAKKLAEELEIEIEGNEKKKQDPTFLWLYRQKFNFLPSNQLQDYLSRKRISTSRIPTTLVGKIICHDLKIDDKNFLVVPVYSLKNEEIISYQRISMDEKSIKLFAKKSHEAKLENGIYPIINDNSNDTIFVVESVCNAFVAQALDYNAVCIFSAGKAEKIVPKIMAKYKGKDIILCLDSDKHVEQVALAQQHGLTGLYMQSFLTEKNITEKSSKNLDLCNLFSLLPNCADYTALVTDNLISAQDIGNKIFPFVEKKASTEKEAILVTGGQLHLAVDAAEKLLLEDSGKDKIYQKSQSLIRIIKDENKGVILREIEKDYLIEKLTRIGIWKRYKKDSVFRIDCPKQVAASYIARRSWDLPALEGIITAPTLRADGSILQKPGYDSSARLFFLSTISYPSIPENPSHMEAFQACTRLKKLLEGFDFVEEYDRSVVLSGILSSMIRHSLPSVPMHAFTAPKMASGKTLQTDIISLISTGKESTKVSWAKTPEEEKKQLFSALIHANQTLCFDNVSVPLRSESLCTCLTSSAWEARVLGTNKMVSVNTTNTLIMATGNNLSIVGDLSTRTLLCSIDPKIERPEDRVFDINLKKYIPENRATLVVDALTILRAYHVAGRPKIEGSKTFGRFEEWFTFVRNALCWVGEKDPCLSRKKIEDTDPDRENLVSLLSSWYNYYGEQVITTRTLKIQMTTAMAEQERIMSDFVLEADKIKAVNFWDAMAEVSRGYHGDVDWRKLSCYLRSVKDRIEGGYRLIRGNKTKNGVMWHVEKI